MKKEILKTDIHERNANPNLNEVFEFGLPYDVVKQQNLSFTLMYMDKFSHPFPVGEVTHHLDHLEMVGTGTVREEMIVCREIQRLQQVSVWHMYTEKRWIRRKLDFVLGFGLDEVLHGLYWAVKS